MSPEYPDLITIVETTLDGYGNETVADQAEVEAIWEQNTSWRHGASQDTINSDAVAFVSPDNDFVQDKFNRLEGMMVMAEFFGGTDWYRITSVTVSRDTQLTNEIDNIQLNLKKSSGITGVS